MSPSVIIVGGGEEISPLEFAALSRVQTEGCIVIAADSGIDRAHEVGLQVDVAIGDFDSVSATGYLRTEAGDVELLTHPAVKNETDLELALLHALSLSASQVVVVAIGGGRLDHWLAGLLLLADQRFAGMEIDAFVHDSHVRIVHSQRVLTAPIGSLLTLLPLGGDAVGVSAHGVEYPLDDETLPASSPRGLSNLFRTPLAVVSLKSGTLMSIQSLEETLEGALAELPEIEDEEEFEDDQEFEDDDSDDLEEDEDFDPDEDQDEEDFEDEELAEDLEDTDGIDDDDDEDIDDADSSEDIEAADYTE